MAVRNFDHCKAINVSVALTLWWWGRTPQFYPQDCFWIAKLIRRDRTVHSKIVMIHGHFDEADSKQFITPFMNKTFVCFFLENNYLLFFDFSTFRQEFLSKLNLYFWNTSFKTRICFHLMRTVRTSRTGLWSLPNTEDNDE